MYKQDFSLNNVQSLIHHKLQPTGMEYLLRSQGWVKYNCLIINSMGNYLTVINRTISI